MNSRRSDAWGCGGGGRYRRGGPRAVDAAEVGRGGRRGCCGRTDGEEVHGAGWDGVPRGGGRGRCWGGGYGAPTPEARGAAEADRWRLVEELRRRVEALEGRPQGEPTTRDVSPTPEAR